MENNTTDNEPINNVTATIYGFHPERIGRTRNNYSNYKKAQRMKNTHEEMLGLEAKCVELGVDAHIVKTMGRTEMKDHIKLKTKQQKINMILNAPLVKCPTCGDLCEDVKEYHNDACDILKGYPAWKRRTGED